MGDHVRIAKNSRNCVLALALMCATACRSEDLRLFHASPTAAQLALEDGLGISGRHLHALEERWDTVKRFEELVLRSDLIVRGVVEARRPGPSKGPVPAVASTVRILQVLRAGANARATATGSTLEIVEEGGRLPDGCFAEPDGKPVLKRGEDAVFFLANAGRPGAYRVVGGWQGRLWVLGRKIRSLAADLHPGDRAATAHDGQSLDQLTQAVQAVPCG